MAIDGNATIAKWTRKWEKTEDDDKNAISGMKEALAKAMRDAGTHKNISQELLNARQGGEPIKDRSCWGDDGEEFTGIYEERLWERE
jgi:hypothetical protein